MIAQLQKNIEWSGIILTTAKENSQKLEHVYALHGDLSAIFPLKGTRQEQLSLLNLADEKIIEIQNDLRDLKYKETNSVKRSYLAVRMLINALKAEFDENEYSEESVEILDSITYHLRKSMDSIVSIMNSRSDELIEANSKSNGLFINLKSYMVNFCLVIALILLTSAIYLNRLLRQPVRELARAADEIRSGNLEFTLDLRDIPRDELGMLMRNFNVMARRLSHTASRLEDANKTLKQEADVLSAVAEQKTKFIRHLGHELRAPLSSIIGFAELLSEGYYGDLTEKQEDYLNRINRSANHLLELVNDLVDQAKMQAGTLKLNYEEFELFGLVEGVVNSFEAKALSFDGSQISKKQKINCDGKRVSQAVINLISNAMKFTPDGESVTVSVRIQDDEAVVDVKDTGIGIAEDDLEAIFQEFRQADTLKTSEGAGLGLPLSRQLVVMHGGTINVKSELGKGACFSMIIPLERPADMPDIMETAINIF
jgi:signal transduction histidine kinase